MRAIAPRTGAPEVTIAEEQEEYMPITVALYDYSDGSRGLLTRWQPSPEERQAIAAGADVFVQQLNFRTTACRACGVETPQGMTPLSVRCGPGEWAVPGGV